MEVNEPESGPESNIYDICMHFGHIPSLTLVRLHPKLAMLFINKYGHALKTLTIFNTPSEDPPYLSPHEILTLCPRLEKLVLRGGSYVDRCGDIRPIPYLPQLKELEGTL